MRSQQSVLVLGAGASKGFGFPLGNELKSKLAKDLRIMFDFGSRLESGSHEIVQALWILVQSKESGQRGDINPHRTIAVRISEAMGPSGSIDEFVERHRHDPRYADCAKLGIAKAILEAERESTLYAPYGHEGRIVQSNSDSWLSMFLRDITRRLTPDEVYGAFANISIINFNYDRCVEHFIFLWLKHMYDFSDTQAAEICNNISIYHPYGKLGNLPYENPSNHIAFGGELDGARLVSIAHNIRTYSETAQASESLEKARKALHAAQKVVFLGYGFHEQNMDVLALSGFPERPTLRCYATVKDVSKPRIEIDKQSVQSALGVMTSTGLFFDHVDGTCEDFWREYGDVVCR